ncbi:hypothetical protein AQ771_14020 [Burkholderia pseudomallei]|nr:hypothetical protein SY87_00850 [Burkholderia pseudomallei]KJR91508.1 hypothetical protein VP95_23645 [Burkholderia pseudomallei]OMR31196.1 hypothetical protein AQ722_04510 [Burkholderia pseudomallei]OMR44979.1 hypothetical protein AQ724_05110 [Burkholderia pseudomallei]OMR48798.1 hypothetical protein AQ725_04330 [Burkholderia pseudomallei]
MLLMTRDPTAQLVRVDIMVHGRPGDRYARLQAKLDQLPHGIFIKFPPAIPSAANHQSASKVLFLCHHGLSACVHADT